MGNCCTIPIDIFESETIDIEIDATGYPVYPETYNGSYKAVPTTKEQVFKTDGLMMLGDFVVEKIPDYYGLITWNGSFLKVS